MSPDRHVWFATTDNTDERTAGDLTRAAEHLRMAYALVLAQDVRGDVAAVAGELACILSLQGERDEAVRLADESRSLHHQGDIVSEVLWRRAQALVAAQDGRHEDAVRQSDDARDRAERTDWLTFRGETLEEAAFVRRLAGDVAGEVEALRAALATYEQKGKHCGSRPRSGELGRFRVVGVSRVRRDARTPRPGNPA